MVCHSAEESSNFRSHSPLPHHHQDDDNHMEIELASETTIFLPVEQDISQRNSGDEPNGENYSGSGGQLGISESSSGSNRNLAILVISDELSLDVEKDVADFDHLSIITSASAVPSQISYKGIKVGLVGKDEQAQSLHVSQNMSETGGDVKSGGGWCRNYLGILLTLASGLLFTIGGVIVKYLKGYHPFTLSVFRFQGILIPGFFMLLYTYYVKKVPVFEPVWPLTQKQKAKRGVGLLLRCLFGTTASFLHFYALQRLDVADALVIGSCQPVFVTIAAYFFLGEACGIFPVFTAVLTIVGVGVISRPPFLTGEQAFDNDALIGAGFSMSCLLAATMVFIIIRYLKEVHVSLITFVFGFWGTLQSILGSVIIGEFTLPQTLEHWLLAVALAVLTLMGQITMTLALQCEQAGSVAVVRTCDCLFAFLLQFILLNTIPDLYSLTGASIIIFCVILTTFRKWLTTLPKTHQTRKRFWFVMV